MKKLLSVVLIIMIVSAVLIPMCASADGIHMWVNCKNGKNLNVREQPTTGSRREYTLPCGTEVIIQDFVGANGWAQIVPAKGGKPGFVMTKFLQDTKPGKYEITEREDDFKAVTPYMATATALNAKTDRSVGLRTQPNKTASSLRRLYAGDQVQVIAQGRNWDKVIDPQTGRTGYVAKNYLQAV